MSDRMKPARKNEAKGRLLAAALCLAGLAIQHDTAAAQGNAEAGEQVFKKCAACHKVGPDARNAVGPVLNGVIDRPAGTAPDYAYSELNKAAGGNGLVWTEAMIFDYLADPSPFLKKFLTDKGKADIAAGATKMVFKLADETDRKDVIAYLKTFSKPK
jgi:cytochrome c